MDKLILNCSKELGNYPYNINGQFDKDIESVSSEVKALGLATATWAIIVVFIDICISYDCYNRGTSLLKPCYKLFNTKIVSRTIVLIAIVIVLPIIILLLIIALLYKVLCSVIIKRNDKHFVGFLDSFDVFWSLEQDSTKSIINVLGVIESESHETISNNIKEQLKNIFTNVGTRKIFYRRNEEYGFYYWRKYSFVDINEYVEVVELPDVSHPGMTDLENLLTDVQNKTLPFGDKGLFKILITRQRIGNYGEEKGEYGIIFRIHHSIGDGVALIEFLCQTFADKAEDTAVTFSIPEYSHDSLEIMQMMEKLCEIPICFVDNILRKPDDNSFHGPALLGKKVFKWTVSDENLLVKVKEIKENVVQLNFCDVLLTALSNGLRHFLKENKANVPEDVAVILPVRFSKSATVECDLKLANEFSVSILDLPVARQDNMNEVRSRCNQLRRSSDPLTNYYFLKLVTTVFPKQMLLPILNSSQASVVFSNMPGPETLNVCGGNQLKSLVFFVPNKGTTGVGVTAFSYGGVLSFAAMADTAVIPSSEQLGNILDGMVEEINRLHKRYVL